MAGRKRLIFAAFPAHVALIRVRLSGCAAAQVGKADRTIIRLLFRLFLCEHMNILSIDNEIENIFSRFKSAGEIIEPENGFFKAV
jgi:hypothetical protein